jgi:hypothetical protein
MSDDCNKSAEGNGDSRSLKRVVVPPEVEAIAVQIRADEQRMLEWEREQGLPPTELDQATQEWWVMERAWMRWAKQQPVARLVSLMRHVAQFWNKQTEPNALLMEAADRLERKKSRRHNAEVSRPAPKTETL